MDTTLQTYAPRTQKCASPSRGKRRGRLEAQHCSDRGGWIIAYGARWYFKWTDNRAIRPSILDQTLVEFTLSRDERGRPVAVDVEPVNSRTSH